MNQSDGRWGGRIWQVQRLIEGSLSPNGFLSREIMQAGTVPARLLPEARSEDLPGAVGGRVF